jgi:NAD(P)-dependent dehydrogenase (short-subunit alcohol dehydrogenase family)
MYDLSGKVAIVTGASRPKGIGRATALRLAREGADVVIADYGRPGGFADHPDYEHLGRSDEMDAVVSEIEALGRRSVAIAVDVTQRAEVEAMVATTVAELGRVDILVNNAGVGLGGPLIDYPEESWDRTLAVNAKGPFLCAQAAARVMIEQGDGGRIVTTASQAGKTGFPNLGAYTASKFAVVGMTQVLGLELAPHRINVNCVCPGTVDTDLMAPGIAMMAALHGSDEAKARELMAARIPLGRLETGDDVANLIVWLCSDQGGYLTGQALNVTGGQEMH